MKKIIYLAAACAAAGATSTVAVAQTAPQLPSNCHYHSDGRVHCTYQPPR